MHAITKEFNIKKNEVIKFVKSQGFDDIKDLLKKSVDGGKPYLELLKAKKPASKSEPAKEKK